MINKISFKNYKSFKELQELELKPITVLIGKNSSGKSAVAKLPTLIENSLKGQFSDPLLLINNNVELGAEFKDLIFGRTRIGSLEIILEDEQERLEVIIASGTGSRDLPKIFSWKLKTQAGEFEENENGNFMGFLCKSNDNKKVIKSLELKTEYIGPFRIIPERAYSRPNATLQDNVGIKGEFTYHILIQDSLSIEEVLLKKVSNWYEENFDLWGIKVNEEKDPFYQIELTRDNGALNINLKDVGQGMGQALPLVVSSFMKSSDETLIILEQPELHLHPAAHGSLAKLFVDSCKDNKKRYLIETHSQNFILRLRRLIAEGYLNKEDLIIYSVEFNPINGSSSLKKILVDEFGEVNYWPEDVFNESLDEALAIRKAQKR
jgi:predicted ATPase